MLVNSNIAVSTIDSKHHCIKPGVKHKYNKSYRGSTLYRQTLNIAVILCHMPKTFTKVFMNLLLLSASPYSGSPQRDSNLHFT